MQTKELLTLFNIHYKSSISFMETTVKNDFYGIKQDPRNENMMRSITSKQIANVFSQAKIYVVPELPSINDDDIDETIGPYDVGNINLPSKHMYIVVDNATSLNNDIVGFLVGPELILCFIRIIVGDDIQYGSLVAYANGVWSTGRNSDARCNKAGIKLLKVVEAINSLQVIKVNGVNDKSFFRIRDSIFKKSKIKPLDYYTVTLQSRIVHSSKPSSESQTERQYAYDVRGHHAHRILTGSLPIDPKIENYLKKDSRRKIFYSIVELDDDSRDLLLDRNIIVKEGEWVSILKYWISDHIANSKDGKNPYVPSIHVAK